MRAGRANVGWSVRGFLLYALALPLLPALLLELDGGGVLTTAALAIAIALFVVAALSVRHGTRRQRERAMSRFHRSNTHSLTWVGCAAVAAACVITQWLVNDRSVAFALAFGAGGFLATYLSYGSMWLRSLPEPADGYSSDEIVDALATAEQKVHDLQKVYVRLPHGELRRRLKDLVNKSFDLLHTIEQEPHMLRRSRKYLNVFLPGVHKVAGTYLASRDQGADPAFDERFKSILEKTSRAIDEQTTQRGNQIAFDLDVQMAVLRQQLDEELRP
ncbi:MAG: 5-bromo-4-chloroindolyl phosphate hydrolysis family protein [Pseudomonadota bacterium]